MYTRAPAPWLLLVLWASGSIACGPTASLRDNLYRDEETAYRIGSFATPWRRVQLDGADLAYRHAPTGAAVQLNSRCRRSDDVPLSALLGHLLIGFTDREVLREERIALDRREALHAVLDARLDGVPVRLGVYVLKKDGCVYDFTLVSASGQFGAVEAEFDRFVRDFHALSGVAPN